MVDKTKKELKFEPLENRVAPILVMAPAPEPVPTPTGGGTPPDPDPIIVEPGPIHGHQGHHKYLLRVSR